MKVALLNTYETGGAARACYRLLQGLASTSVDARMIVRDSAHFPGIFSAGGGGFVRALLDGLTLHRYPKRQPHNFSPAWIPGNAIRVTAPCSPDIVHLHWVVEGFVRIESLCSLKVPILWTMHDSWPFTGGCHLPGECSRYEQSCGSCPVLGSKGENDWSRHVWQRKRRAWKNLPLTIVSPSRWLAERARASSLFAGRRIEVIPNGIDTDFYCPGDRLSARRELCLPLDRQLLLFGANHALSDSNKGFDLLQRALRALPEKYRQTAELLVFGEDADRLMPECGIPARNLGQIADERRLVQLYRAADMCLVPSRQENLPNMVIEAMACGIPCIAFAVGGLPELIEHEETGYLAHPCDIEDLAHGIESLLTDTMQRLVMAEKSRAWVEQNVSMVRVAQCYVDLYREVAVS